jgi:1-phosphatidylinositol-3-phosphate 5-kinase
MEYFVVMENINYGLMGKKLKVYDLKGSKANRFAETKIVGETLLDTNYNLERNGDPLSLRAPPNLDLFQALSSDSRFLSQNEIVDYSLLVVMDVENKVIKVGIIDYLQNYNLTKKTEHLIKKFKNMGKNPTIVKPNIYAQRFFN